MGRGGGGGVVELTLARIGREDSRELVMMAAVALQLRRLGVDVVAVDGDGERQRRI
jgi:hypothetical protein